MTPAPGSAAPPPHEEPKPGFFPQAARASWAAPVIGIFVGSVARRSSPFGADCRMMLLVGAGFAFAIVALLGMAKVGRRGILSHAIAGLAVNLLLGAIFTVNVVAAVAKG